MLFRNPDDYRNQKRTLTFFGNDSCKKIVQLALPIWEINITQSSNATPRLFIYRVNQADKNCVTTL